MALLNDWFLRQLMIGKVIKHVSVDLPRDRCLRCLLQLLVVLVYALMHGALRLDKSAL